MTFNEKKQIAIKKIAKEVMENLNGRTEPREIMEAVFVAADEHTMTNEDRNAVLNQVMTWLVEK